MEAMVEAPWWTRGSVGLGSRVGRGRQQTQPVNRKNPRFSTPSVPRSVWILTSQPDQKPERSAAATVFGIFGMMHILSGQALRSTQTAAGVDTKGDRAPRRMGFRTRSPSVLLVAVDMRREHAVSKGGMLDVDFVQFV